jgi:uncharacterized protein (TIGR03435 family)
MRTKWRAHSCEPRRDSSRRLSPGRNQPSGSRELLAVGVFSNKSRLSDRIEMLLRRGRTFSPRASVGGVMASVAVLGGMMLAGSLAPRWIAFAQQQPRPSFEVASIKPGDPASRQVSTHIQPDGRLTATNATLQMLIRAAYDLRDHQIREGPNWLDSAAFNIEAKAAGPVPGAQMRLMLQSLLAERFKLAVHLETREEPVYELVVDKGGYRLREAADTAHGSRQGIGIDGAGSFGGFAASVSQLASWLSQRLDRSVIDKTGLTGKYDFTLHWTPDPGDLGGPAGGPDAPPDTSGPSIFTALKEDLGLKLQSSKGPVEVLVIDHAEKPDAN